MFALCVEGVLPVADAVLAEAEGACGLGDGVALLGDELDGFRLELRGVGAPCSCHCWTSQGDCTPLTGCPLSEGKSKPPEHFFKHTAALARELATRLKAEKTR